MDVIILCGGKGTRLSEETVSKPKPMVNIGQLPILWHIMKLYSFYGFNRFILALGYKGEYIKEYFYNYKVTRADFSMRLGQDNIEYLKKSDEKDWEIVFVDTGEETLKGGRIKRLEKYINTDSFHLTYGDGISDVNLASLVEFHRSHDKIGTVTAVRPPSRFGELNIKEDNTIISLEEKPQMGQGMINGGIFVFDKEMLNYLSSKDSCDFEFGPLQQICKDKQLKAFIHNGFWQCMDNVRERDYLEDHVKEKTAPWMLWK